MKNLVQMERKTLSAAEVRDQMAKAQRVVRALARLQEKTGIVLIQDQGARKAG
jgi:hypothetical protein